MFSEKTRRLFEFPGIVGSPVDDNGRAFGADQVKGFEPDFVVHQHAENHVRPPARYPLDQCDVEISEIAVKGSIARIEKVDLVAHALERRDEVDIIVIFAALRLAIRIAAQHA